MKMGATGAGSYNLQLTCLMLILELCLIPTAETCLATGPCELDRLGVKFVVLVLHIRYLTAL